jgi:hypothetical protein
MLPSWTKYALLAAAGVGVFLWWRSRQTTPAPAFPVPMSPVNPGAQLSAAAASSQTAPPIPAVSMWRGVPPATPRVPAPAIRPLVPQYIPPGGATLPAYAQTLFSNPNLK